MSVIIAILNVTYSVHSVFRTLRPLTNGGTISLSLPWFKGRRWTARVVIVGVGWMVLSQVVYVALPIEGNPAITHPFNVGETDA